MCQYCVATALAFWNLYYQHKEVVHEKMAEIAAKVKKAPFTNTK